MNQPTGSVLLAKGVRQLTDAGVPDAPRDARRLLAHAVGVEAGRLTLILPEPVTQEAEARFAALLQRRAGREPVSHLLGYREFYGRRFKVTRNVLDPRPETEILIEVALQDAFASVIDLGTGSGCILLTLLAEMPEARGVGTDLSEDACRVAEDNMHALDLGERAAILRTSWADGIEGQVDLVVSNPPYIGLDEMDGLSPEVHDHEPHMALTDGGDGLSAYREISQQAANLLRVGGRLIVEIGPTQAVAVAQMFADNGFEKVRVIQDLDGRDRVVSGEYHG
ncbi:MULTISPECIES: peptide chain release factor N(5)-glutamine methyltransferase [unclassified Marivivens]|jgi:release factor glutamine methyltransferase|uniref:peptide chain release factor N(5)-glutamine methyltransferase n=1 Tax=unclassified Marivivens TaxID=2622455 RepID=UPI0007FCE292|nr:MULTISPECIES: peptide chain release factor N(5)-glutamine methyltransferase [unclassified Marivivens]APO86483.1 protein-(glutamine-N5) methyltransferase, release factor-specific [Marivivens sp. JLT3646]NVJ94832.1 peptide chain release factor N(5)-glutamine methyltransferase [Marivivens sp.]OBR37730.1 protein-(glutamine-N5) methyltransferase, release factor-specific [Donghicola sp. JL3646]